VNPMALLKAKKGNGGAAGPARDWLSPLNLHWAGVGLLALVNLYLLVHMALLWHGEQNYNADAQVEQRMELKTAGVAAAPLRGLDVKLAAATSEADRFYRQRLPGTESDILSELGALSKKSGVRLMRVQYSPPVIVLAGTDAQLTDDHMDATLSGDYRPLVMFMNSLERDKMFFVINSVTLTGQQTGTVSLRLRLTTYLRAGGTQEPAPDDAAKPVGPEAMDTGPAIGGPGR